MRQTELAVRTEGMMIPDPHPRAGAGALRRGAALSVVALGCALTLALVWALAPPAMAPQAEVALAGAPPAETGGPDPDTPRASTPVSAARLAAAMITAAAEAGSSPAAEPVSEAPTAVAAVAGRLPVGASVLDQAGMAEPEPEGLRPAELVTADALPAVSGDAGPDAAGSATPRAGGSAPRIGLARPAPELLPTELTFRRIAVPPPGSVPRIGVQIDPAEQARLLANPPAVPPRPSASAAAAATAAAGSGGASSAAAPALPLGWFWDATGTEIGALPGRYSRAMAALAAPPAGATPVPTPRLEVLRRIAGDHGAELLRASIGTRVSPALALAVIAVESSGNARAVSRAGAQGLMQLIPATAARFGVEDAFEPGQNIAGGIAYLDWLLGHFDGDLVLALAGYNAGEGAVRNSGGVPPYAETRNYVPRVLAAWEVARGLCRTRPELPGDGCVFVTGTTAAIQPPTADVTLAAPGGG